MARRSRSTKRRLLGASGITLMVAAMIPAAHATDYFVDSSAGHDTASGTTITAPLLSLEAAAARASRPGDRILLKAGSHWHGALVLRHSGRPNQPIVVDRYGEGAMPRIDAGDVAADAVALQNVEYVTVRHLDVTNHGTGESERRGVLIAALDAGTLHDITVSDLYIHDVNGTNEAKETGGILFRTVGKAVPNRFDRLKIERNIVWKVDRSGIVGQSDQLSRARWFPSLHVIIRDNYVEDVGGDGIVPWATDGALVEHNIVRHTVQRADSYNAGIWPWSTDNTLLQLNEAAFTKGQRDGEGFDSDYNSRNSAFYFNYSHDNDGGFMLICTPVKRDDSENIGNSGTIVRMNISRNDHTRIFNIAGADASTIEDNAFYIAAGDDVQAVLMSDWDGWSDGATFRRNLFQAIGTARYGHQIKHTGGLYEIDKGWGPARHIVFDGNSYIGTQIGRPDDTHAIIRASAADPALPWNGPAFDPANPANFSAFLARHRAWMMQLMTAQFGKVRLRQPHATRPGEERNPSHSG